MKSYEDPDLCIDHRELMARPIFHEPRYYNMDCYRFITAGRIINKFTANENINDYRTGGISNIRNFVKKLCLK